MREIKLITGANLVNKLPREVRKRFWKNVVVNRISVKEDKFADIEDLIDLSFDMNLSYEGRRFWREIYLMYRHFGAKGGKYEYYRNHFIKAFLDAEKQSL